MIVIFEEGFNGSFGTNTIFEFNGGNVKNPPPGIVVDALNSASGIGYLQMYDVQMCNIRNNNLRLKPDFDYQLKLYAKRNILNTNRTYNLHFWVSNGENNGDTYIYEMSPNYQQYTVNFTTNSTPQTYPGVRIYISTGPLESGVDGDPNILTGIDNVELIEIGPKG